MSRLKRDPAKQRAWRARSKPLTSNSTLKPGKGLKRSGSLKRGGPIKAKPRVPLTEQQVERRNLWITAVLDSCKVGGIRRCAVCGEPAKPGNRLQGHHVVDQQVLERKAKDLGLDPEEVVWNPDSGMPVHERRHEQHTIAFKRLPRSAIPGNCIAFIDALGLGGRLDREYADG